MEDVLCACMNSASRIQHDLLYLHQGWGVEQWPAQRVSLNRSCTAAPAFLTNLHSTRAVTIALSLQHIHEFILYRMVHSTDIVEFELRSKKFSLAVRKKEALEVPEPVYMPV